MNKLLLALGEFKRTSTDELNFCCPFCVKRLGRADKGFHLYVNPMKYIDGIRGWFYCHRCKARGPLSRLLGKDAETGIGVGKWREFVDSLRGKMNINISKAKPVELPKDYIEIFKGTEAYDYLTDRGITDDQIVRYKIGFGTEDLRDMEPEERRQHAGSGRIIFPDFDQDGAIVYWVARTYRHHKVKYKNPPHSDARDKVYNLANASIYRDVVITEGVISALAAGYNGVATYGKEVTSTQVSMLVRAAFEKYIIALDGDARKEAVHLGERLTRRGCKVSLVEFSQDEDPASVPNIQERLDRSLDFTMRNRLLFTMGR